MNVKTTMIAGGIVAAVAGSATSAALANTIEEILVTAAKRGEQRIQDVPMAISAYGGDELEMFNIINLNKIDLRTPGLVFTENSGTVQPYIRGIGTEFVNTGLEPAVSVYLDDVYWMRSRGANSDLIDFSTAQVLKGPQGTLYGKNATGGAIILTTNDPEFDDSLRIKVQAGKLDHVLTDLIANKQLNEQWAVRFAARYTEQDGHVDNPFTGKEFGGFEKNAYRLKTLYQGDKLRALLTLSYNENESYTGLRQQMLEAPLCVACELTGGSPPSDDYETYQSQPVATEDRTWYGTLKLDYELDNVTFTSITTYRDLDATSGTDEGTFAGAGPNAIDLLTFLVTESKAEDIMQEFRLTSDLEGRFNYLVGVEGSRSEETFGTDLSIGLSSFTDAVMTSASAYAEFYYDLTDDLQLTVGGRYSYDKRDVDNSVLDAVFWNYEGSWNEFTPRVVLAWTPDDNQNYYINYSEGFKAGGFQAPTFAQSDSDELDAETIKNLEIGAKNIFLDGKLRTTLAIFYYEHTDLQVAFVDASSGGTVRENAGSSKAHGIELDVSYLVNDNFTVDFGYAYLDATYDEFENAALFYPNPDTGVGLSNGGGVGFDLGGERLTRAPENTAYLSLSYNFTLPGDWQGSVHGIARYTDEYDFIPGRGGPLGLDYQESFTLVNLGGSIGPSSGKYAFGFYVDNATDEVYYQNINTGNLGAYRGVSLPRTYGVSFTIDL